MRIVYFSSAAWTIPLDEFFYSRDALSLIVTSPARPKGRGLASGESPHKEFATEKGITCLRPEFPSDPLLLEEVKKIAPDYIFVTAYGGILPPELLKIPSGGAINLHYSLLPAYRGPSCIQQALLNGDRETGVSLVYMTEKVDAGPVISRKNISVRQEDNFTTLSVKLVQAGYELLSIMWDLEKDWKLLSQQQDDRKASYTEKISKEDGNISFDLPAEKIFNIFRAYRPWPGAYFFIKGRRVIITGMKLCEKQSEGQNGVFTRISGNNMIISGNGSDLEIEKVKPEGKREISGRDFINGLRLLPGVSLGK